MHVTMLSLFATAFTAFIFSCDAASRYVIGDYEVPFLDPTPIAFPLDTCVTYMIELEGLDPLAVFAKFECTNDGSGVIRTEFGTDPTCSAANSGVSTTVSDAAADASGLGSFSCTGDDNYGSITSCFDDAAATEPSPGDIGSYTLCCEINCIQQTHALDICVEVGSEYRKFSCNANGLTQSVHSLADCSDNEVSYSAESTSSCKFTERQVIFDLWARSSSCVVQGTERAAQTFCNGPATGVPTTSPSNSPTSESPSMSPTNNPSTASVAPSMSTMSPSIELVDVSATMESTGASEESDEDGEQSEESVEGDGKQSSNAHCLLDTMSSIFGVVFVAHALLF